MRLPTQIPSVTLTRDGLDIGWNEDMNQYLGEVTTVTSPDPEFTGVVHVAIDQEKWLWLMDWLTAAQ